MNGYEWQGHRLEVKEGKYEDRAVSTTTSIPRSLPSTISNSRPLPPTRQLNLDSPSRESLNRIPPPMADISSHHYNHDSQIANTVTPVISPPSNTITASISPPISAVPLQQQHQQHQQHQHQQQHQPSHPPQPPVETIPPPYQNMYRYGEATAAAIIAPPPPPPMYSSISLVGGPAANLPTHGHNQIFVNNVSKMLF